MNQAADIDLAHDMVIQGHLGGCAKGGIGDPQSYVPSVWAGLIEAYGIKSVLDLGCGYGYATKWFQDQGLYCFALDGMADAVANTVAPHRHRVQCWDFAEGPFPYFLGHYGLCWCSEFAEHVAQEHEVNWLAAAGRCDVIALTAALPGQAGHHHVNCRPPGYWVRRFEGLGYRLDAMQTDWLRAVANEAHPCSYFGRVGLIFVRRAS